LTRRETSTRQCSVSAKSTTMRDPSALLGFVPPATPRTHLSTSSSASCHLLPHYQTRFCQSCRRIRRISVQSCVEQPPSTSSPTPSSSSDLVERIYALFFGDKKSTPFGLSRFDADRFPELYPATLTEFAPPHLEDSPEAALFRPLLARTQLATRAVALAYNTDVDDWDAEAFHAAVDRKGAAVGICKTQTSGAVCGFYNPKGFVGYGESRGSIAAFVFTWQDGDTSRPPAKLRKVGKAYGSVLDSPDAGPTIGADTLVIPLRPPRATWPTGSENDRIARSKLGSYFERLTEGSCRNTLFGKGDNAGGEKLEFLRVYTGVYEEGEEIPFNDVCETYSTGGLSLSHRRQFQHIPLTPFALSFCLHRPCIAGPSVFSRVIDYPRDRVYLRAQTCRMQNNRTIQIFHQAPILKRCSLDPFSACIHLLGKAAIQSGECPHFGQINYRACTPYP
jgi:hypothetical protein